MWEAAAYFGSGEVPQPSGTRHRRNAPYQAYRTSDGYVTIGGNTEPMWRLLCMEVLQTPALLEDPRYATKDMRLAHLDQLEEDIERITTTRPTEHWVARLDEARLLGGPVLTYDETLANEHVIARGMVRQVEHPTMGTIRTLGPPAKFSATPLQLRLPAPAVGEHTAAVLGELGLAPSDLDQLIRWGRVRRRAS